MAEDTRLKHSTERFYLKVNPTTNPINPNINKQFTWKNYRKETSTNDIEYTVMDDSGRLPADCCFRLWKGTQETPGEVYIFEGKPISKRLTKFNKIKQTMEYKSYELKEKRD